MECSQSTVCGRYFGPWPPQPASPSEPSTPSLCKHAFSFSYLLFVRHPPSTVGFLSLPWRLKRPAACLWVSFDQLLHHFCLTLDNAEVTRKLPHSGQTFVVESRRQQPMPCRPRK